jgi:omega-amidase
MVARAPGPPRYHRPSMRVAAFQFDVRPGDVAANLAAVEAALREAAAAQIELVCLPELWPTSFPAGDGPTEELLAAGGAALERVRVLSAELSLVVAGSALGPACGPASLPTNRFHLFERGRLLARYDKVHLFSPTAEPEAFSAGEHPPPVVNTRLGRVAGAICYDLRFPELARVAFRGGAEALLVPAQWPTPRLVHWRALCVARAVEGQFAVVAANRTGSERVGRRGLELEFSGGSLIVAPGGEVLAEGGAAAGLISAQIDLEQGRRLRTRIPIAKDERPELYRRWL